jgi:hypothetical protein
MIQGFDRWPQFRGCRSRSTQPLGSAFLRSFRGDHARLTSGPRPARRRGEAIPTRGRPSVGGTPTRLVGSSKRGRRRSTTARGECAGRPLSSPSADFPCGSIRGSGLWASDVERSRSRSVAHDPWRMRFRSRRTCGRSRESAASGPPSPIPTHESHGRSSRLHLVGKGSET